MDKRYRYIYFFDLTLKTNSLARGVTNVMQKSLSEVLAKVHATNPKGRHFSYQKDSLHFYIADWHFDAELNQYHLLINKSDRNSADPIFTDVVNKTRREIAKNDGEGLDHSSHVILQLNNDTPYTAVVLLERGGLASSYYLQVLFTRLISETRVTFPDFFTQNHPDGSIVKGEPRKMNIRCAIDVDGHISDDFKNDLLEGTFQEIVLISQSATDSGIDSNFEPKEKTETIKLKPHKQLVIDRLKGLVTSKSSEYEKARIRFKHRDGTERDIEVDTGTFSETNYVKKARIESDTDFKSSYELIDRKIINLMKAIA